MKWIILDRDGVINYDSDDYIKSEAEWHALPGSLAAIAKLNQAGFKVAIVTNQSGLARGYYDLLMLEKIHSKMLAELAAYKGQIQEIIYCPHHPNDGCLCRKPQTGMLKALEQKYQISLAGAYFIGDSKGDIEAAKKHNMQALLVLTGKGQRTLLQLAENEVLTFADLAAAVEYILKG